MSKLAKKGLSKLKRDGITGVFQGVITNVSLGSQKKIVQFVPSIIPNIFTKPHTVTIETTNDCNLRCKMCYRGKRKVGYMDFELFKKVVDEVASIGGVCLRLHYSGETTLHPRFADMLQYVMAKRPQFYNVGFFTNGMLLKEKLSKLIVDLGVDWISVSIEGIGEVNDKIRIGSNYSVIKSNLEKLLLIRGSKPKPIITTNTTLTTQTDDELEAIKKEWLGKVDDISFNGYVDPENFSFDDVKRFAKYNPKGMKENLSPICHMPFTLLIVLWNGDLIFCCHNLNGRFPVGNIQNNGLLEIWNSKRMIELRKSIVRKCPVETELCFYCKKFKWKNRK